MYKLTDIQIKQVELKILLYIKKICEKENIRYGLAYGTLLGAIRHNGFIPWDDDIDIFMPYEDYVLFNEKFISDDYYLENWEKVNNYWLDFTKVVDSNTKIIEKNNVVRSTPGLFVDIFPLVGFGNNLVEARKHLKKLQKMKVKIKYANTKKIVLKKLSISQKIKKILVYYFSKISLFLINKKKFISKYNKLLSQYGYDNSTYVGYVDMDGGFMDVNKLFEKSIFSNFDNTVLFENYNFSSPVECDKFLRIQYGKDYMKIPSKDKRVSHNIDAFRFK